jgi:molecular chaperone GrpE
MTEEKTLIEEPVPQEEANPTCEPLDPAASLQAQLEEFKDKYFRALAEGENTRKRLAKEKQEMLRFGIDNAISEFLPVIDNFEMALCHADAASPEIKNWAMGFQMIMTQFKEVLHNQGIVAFHSEGNQFDPSFHDAVEIAETTEEPEGTILQEFTKGYKSATRTLRPARVKVARAPSKTEQSSEEETVQVENETIGEKS